jgi:hypothetical protein
VGDTLTVTEGSLQAHMEKAKSAGPSILLLDHIEALAKRSDSSATGKTPPIVKIIDDLQNDMRVAAAQMPVVLMATTVDEDLVPGDLLSCFKQDLYITVHTFFVSVEYADTVGTERRREIRHCQRSLPFLQPGARRQLSIDCYADCGAAGW